MPNALPIIKELTDIVINNGRGMGNVAFSWMVHPTDTTILESATGKVVGRYQLKDEPKRQIEPGQEKIYSPGHILVGMYVITREVFLHPLTTSYHDRDTNEVTRESKKDNDYQ